MSQSLFTSVVGCAPRTNTVVVLVRRPRCAQRTLPCAGFTLLEMVLVLFLVGLMASAAMMLTEGVEDQAKYDETKRRMELIRKAIVGDPTRTVNGGPEISGFVADMGRLPGCLRELLEANDCAEPANPLTSWSIDANTGIASGWRGPYIHVLPERDGALRLRDGYGNSAVDDALNSGWQWQLYKADASQTTQTSDAVQIELISDGLKSNTNADDVSADKLVVGSDWQVPLPAAITVTFKNQSPNNLPAVDGNLVLSLNLGDSTEYGDDGVNDYLTLTASEVTANNVRSRTFILNSSPVIALGSRSYAIVCYDPAKTNPDEFVIFDGDCDSANGAPGGSNMRAFSAVPRQTLNLNLDWIIP